MADSPLLIAYRAMPSNVLEERIRLMQSVLADRAPPAQEPLPPTDGASIDFRDTL